MSSVIEFNKNDNASYVLKLHEKDAESFVIVDKEYNKYGVISTSNFENELQFNELYMSFHFLLKHGSQPKIVYIADFFLFSEKIQYNIYCLFSKFNISIHIISRPPIKAFNHYMIECIKDIKRNRMNYTQMCNILTDLYHSIDSMVSDSIRTEFNFISDVECKIITNGLVYATYQKKTINETEY